MVLHPLLITLLLVTLVEAHWDDRHVRRQVGTNHTLQSTGIPYNASHSRGTSPAHTPTPATKSPSGTAPQLVPLSTTDFASPTNVTSSTTPAPVFIGALAVPSTTTFADASSTGIYLFIPLPGYEQLASPKTTDVILPATRSDGSVMNIIGPVVIFVLPGRTGGFLLLHPIRPPAPGAIGLPTIAGSGGPIRPPKGPSLCVSIIRFLCPKDGGGGSAGGLEDPQSAPESVDPKLEEEAEKEEQEKKSASRGRSKSDPATSLTSFLRSTTLLTSSSGSSTSISSTRTSSTSTSSHPTLCYSECSSCTPNDDENPQAFNELQARVLPQPNDWSDSRSLASYVFRQSRDAPPVEHIGIHNLQGRSPCSTRTFKLETQPLKLKVNGLSGCMSIVIISRRRIWMSHIWEYYPFIDLRNRQRLNPQPLGWPRPPSDSFDSMLMDLASGAGSWPGFQQFLGTNRDFGPDTNVKAYIIATEPKDYSDVGWTDYGVQMDVASAFVQESFRHAGQPAIVIDKVRYTATGNHGPMAIVLFEYDSDRYGCRPPSQKATSRLWLFPPAMFLWQDTWNPFPEQLLRWDKRDDDSAACALSLSDLSSLRSTTAFSTDSKKSTTITPSEPTSRHSKSVLGSTMIPAPVQQKSTLSSPSANTIVASSPSQWFSTRSRSSSFYISPTAPAFAVPPDQSSRSMTIDLSQTRTANVVSNTYQSTSDSVGTTSSIETSNSTTTIVTTHPAPLPSLTMSSSSSQSTSPPTTPTQADPTSLPFSPSPPSVTSSLVLFPGKPGLQRVPNSSFIKSRTLDSLPSPSPVPSPTTSPAPAGEAAKQCSILAYQGVGMDMGTPVVLLNVYIRDGAGHDLGNATNVQLQWERNLELKASSGKVVKITPHALPPKQRREARRAPPLKDHDANGEDVGKHHASQSDGADTHRAIHKRTGGAPPARIVHLRGYVSFSVGGTDSFDSTNKGRCKVSAWDDGGAKAFFEHLVLGKWRFVTRSVECAYTC